MAIRILGPLEFTLGALALRPMRRDELLQLAEDYLRRGHSPLVERERVEVAVNMLMQAGVVYPAGGGRLAVDLERLHPAYQAIARAAANAIARMHV